MLTNSQMKPQRWARLHKANQMQKFINQGLMSGRTVYVSTCTKSIKFKGIKYLAWFRPTQDGLMMLSGRAWVSIEHANLTIEGK